MIHVVILAEGEYDDYRERILFYTENEDTAVKWCKRHNRIVEANYERLNSFYDDGDYDKPEPFMHDYIKYQTPQAIFRTINEKR